MKSRNEKLPFAAVLALVTLAAEIYPSLALGAGAPAEAPGAAATVSSHRMTNKIGAYMAVGEPSPTVLGLNVGYNLHDAVRLSAGFGQISVSGFGTEASATTIGFGATAFVPGWNLTPTLGLHFGHVSYSGNSVLTVGGFSESGSHVYTSLGMDYQAKSGFNGGIGYQLSFKPGIGGGAFVRLGWFFDWLG